MIYSERVLVMPVPVWQGPGRAIRLVIILQRTESRNGPRCATVIWCDSAHVLLPFYHTLPAFVPFCSRFSHVCPVLLTFCSPLCGVFLTFCSLFGHLSAQVFRQLLSTFVLGATWFRSDNTIPYNNPLYLRGDTHDPKLALGSGYRHGVVPFLKLVEAGVSPLHSLPLLVGS